MSADGTVGYATVTLDHKAENVPKTDITTIIDTAQATAGDGLRVELGGDAVRGAGQEAGGAAEGVGLLAALAVLVLLFGSLVAAAVPLVTAVFAVGGAIGLIALVSHLLTVADFTPPIMMLVGLGVGVDYALLIFIATGTSSPTGPPPATRPGWPWTLRAARSSSPAAPSSSRCSAWWRSASARCRVSPWRWR